MTDNQVNNLLVIPDHQLEVLNVFTATGNKLKAEAEGLSVERADDIEIANRTFKHAQALEIKIETSRKDIVFPFNDFVKQINTLAKEVAKPTIEAKLIVSQKLLAYKEKLETIRLQEAEKERLRLEEQRLKEEAERKAREVEEARLRKIEEDKLEVIRKQQEEERLKIAREQDANKRAQQEIEAKKLEEQRKIEEERINIERQKRELEEQQKEIEKQKADMEAAELKKQQERKQEEIDAANKVKGVRKEIVFDIIDEDKVPRAYCSPDDKKIRAAIKLGLKEIEGLKIYTKGRIQ